MGNRTQMNLCTTGFPLKLPEASAKICVLLTLVTLSALLIITISLLHPRALYQKAMTNLALKNYPLAATLFKQSEQSMPGFIIPWFTQADQFRIYTNQGQTLYHLALSLWKKNGLTMKSFDTLSQARSCLVKAAKIQPSLYINTYFLARTEQSLEKSYSWLHPSSPKNPYNADPYFKKAMSLRPSGITVRYAYVKYLQSKGLSFKSLELVQSITRIHPPSYWHLKKESFFNNNLLLSLEKGLNSALKENTLPRDALKALSDIYLVKNNLQKAISYYKQSLDLEPDLITASAFVYMGSLYLKNQQYEKSFASFKKGFQISPSSINRIYGIFKRQNHLEKYLKFTLFLQENNLGSSNFNTSLDMTIARCWTDMGFFQLAKARLIKINSTKPHAPACYRLANIAAREKNWDQMEIFAHQATTLDKDNQTYYTLLSMALVKQKKYTHAEEVATKAIGLAPENPYVFNHRARIRWQLKKYALAASDWKKAFTLKPGQSDFPFRIALACEQQGLFKQALTYAQQACTLAPDNKIYKKLQNRLKPHNQRPPEKISVP
jgi:tetratricopeptide (TPR) repeat protein